jgi:ABC-type Fe3+ transport system substrate-binding protein
MRSFLYWGMIPAFAALVVLSGSVWAAEAPILKSLSGAEKERVATLIEGAKKEGAFSWVANFVPVNTAKALGKDFKEYYGLSDVKVAHADRKSGTLIKRVEEEIRADKLSVDMVCIAAASWLHSMRRRGNLLEYTSPEDKYYEPAAKAKMNAPGYWVADGQITTVSVNQDLAGNVKVESWNDLLKPVFTGKVLVGDAIRSETYTLWYRGMRQVLPRSYFEKLNATKCGVMIRGAAQRRSLMAGEYWAGTTIMPRHSWIARKAGVRLEMFYPKEGVVALPISSIILAKAKHPNAAKLFVDYWRSARGKHLLIADNPINVGRNLPPHPDPKVNKDILARDGIAPPIGKLDIIPVDWAAITPDEVKKWRAEFNEVFGSAPRGN